MFKLASTLFLTGLACAACVSTANNNTPTYLKDAYAPFFMMGTALNEQQISGQVPEDLLVVKSHFNAITPENIMKWEVIHPSPNEYNFSASDQLVALTNEHNLFLIGHTLTWHSQTPDWVFKSPDGELKDREALLALLKEHIYTVAGRYRGQIQGWDVVNEAFNEDGTLRNSLWLQIIGPDYIEKAFEYAHEAAPDAKLYYNDYNLFKPEKRAGVVAMVKRLQAKNIPIDGVGLQGHYALDYPDLSLLEDSIIAYGELGIEVMITELDVSVLPFPDEEEMGADVSINIALQSKFNPYANGLPASINTQLSDRYEALFKLFLKHQDIISRVTFWGVNDRQTWRNNWPMQGRSDYPLLFDRENRPKDAAFTIIQLTQ